ncbi:TIGR04290 family methyltransferase [Pelagibacterium luteolum]|uniref:tRNA (Mo5U34)-methyltransferase n=1 Tax=Pelagibacterium luteolum TaxID=440168 RepID=A0A1G8A5Q0_9HYPH|nr:TIGR04290 family methyltransferase [Pelagibacterium luteolum]SDH16258.1 tRNA (mo5U34)-methyltransferase [Pelagibacterium luteolum]
MNTHQSLAQKIKDLGPWFHNLIIDDIPTAPDHFLGDYPTFKWERFSHVLPKDLSGMSVLDIGCNAGFYTLEMKRRGADRVVGIDSDPRYLAQAEFAAGHQGLDINFRQMTVYDVERLHERFDLVVFMGVLYHLRHPLLALDLIHQHAANDLLLFQSMQRGSAEIARVESDYDFSEWEIFEEAGFPQFSFVEHSYAGDPTNWFIPNRAGMEALLRSAGFSVVANPEREVYLCRRGPAPYFADRLSVTA